MIEFWNVIAGIIAGIIIGAVGHSAYCHSRARDEFRFPWGWDSRPRVPKEEIHTFLVKGQKDKKEEAPKE